MHKPSMLHRVACLVAVVCTPIPATEQSVVDVPVEYEVVVTDDRTAVLPDAALDSALDAVQDIPLPDDTQPPDETIQGVLMNLVGCVMVNGGTNCMKKGITLQKLDPDARWRLFWHSGAVLFVVGNIFNFTSLGMAPQTLLASIGAVQFVTNIFFVRFLLKETVVLRTILATFIIVIGVVIAALFAPRVDKEETINNLISFYGSPVYLAYLGGQAFLILALEPTLCFLTSAAQTEPFRYSVVSAIIGTQSVVQAKCLSGIIAHLIAHHGRDSEGKPLGVRWLFILFVLCVLVPSQVFWLRRMQRGLSMFDGVIIIPLFQVCWMSFSILTGGLYFQELHTLEPMHAAAFAFGILVVFSGVYLLMPPLVEASNAADTMAMRRERTRKSTMFCGPGLLDVLELKDASNIADIQEGEEEDEETRSGKSSRELEMTCASADHS